MFQSTLNKNNQTNQLQTFLNYQSHNTSSILHSNTTLNRHLSRKPNTKISRILMNSPLVKKNRKDNSQTSLHIKYLSPKKQPQITIMNQIANINKLHQDRLHQINQAIKEKQIFHQNQIRSLKRVKSSHNFKMNIVTQFKINLNENQRNQERKSKNQELKVPFQQQKSATVQSNNKNDNIQTSSTIPSNKNIQKEQQQQYQEEILNQLPEIYSQNNSNQIQYLKKELQRQLNLNKKYEKTIEKLTDNIKILQEDSKQWIKQKQQLEQANKNFKNKLLFVENQLNGKAQTLSKMNKKVDKSHLQALKSKNVQLQSENRNLKSNLTKANSQLKYLQNELEYYKKAKTSNIDLKGLKFNQKSKAQKSELRMKSPNNIIMSARINIKEDNENIKTSQFIGSPRNQDNQGRQNKIKSSLKK